MRVIGGAAKGIRLRTARGRWLRPTTDRARTVLFDWLGERVWGSRVLDLYCGSGALGIEALSRGARWAVFVDVRGEALRLVTENLRATSLEGRADLVRAQALAFLRRAAVQGKGFDLVFADPPYAWSSALRRLLDLVPSVLAEGALFVLEHSRRVELPRLPENLRLIDTRSVGESQFTMMQQEGTALATRTESDLSRNV